MPAFDLTLGVTIFCLLTVGFFFCLWMYYDRRDHALYEHERRKVVFHCIRCNHLYTRRAGAETAVCPRCGHENARLKF